MFTDPTYESFIKSTHPAPTRGCEYHRGHFWLKVNRKRCNIKSMKNVKNHLSDFIYKC